MNNWAANCGAVRVRGNPRRAALFLLFSALIAIVSTLRAGTMEDGNMAFARGDYSAAARAYETALSAGKPSAGLYYNLATAQLKNGQKPLAALNLRRAIMLDPRMSDARMALSEIERSQGISFQDRDWRTLLAERVALSVPAFAGAALFWAGAFFLLWAIFRKPGQFAPLAGAFFLLMIGGALLVAGFQADPKISGRHAGVILTDKEVTLLSAPADQSAALARLPGGSCVQILQRRGEWVYCEAPAGEKGWIPSNSVESVVPAA